MPIPRGDSGCVIWSHTLAIFEVQAATCDRNLLVISVHHFGSYGGSMILKELPIASSYDDV